jgi:hypothetical protein
MPYEGDDRMTEVFADQLEIIDSIISNNMDCHIIVGGDFNVDLSRSWAHTAMLNSFCSNVDSNFALHHDKCNVDYTYSFNMCREMNCSNKLHSQHLNKYVAGITESCISAAESVIPHTSKRQTSGRIAGWSEHVQPLRDKSLFWHTIWLDCDRPKTGAVAECMRRTRAAYHYAVRKLKRDGDEIINERIADSLLNNKSRDFWSEIKRIRSNKSGNSCTVDGQSEANNIAKLFAEKYRDLYISVPYDVNEMRIIQEEVNNLLLSESPWTDCTFNTCDVKSTVSHLKAHKNEHKVVLI